MLPLFPQELPTSCVAACVRMVLTSLGHRLSETDIRHRCGHRALGMRLNQVASGLEDLPLDVQHQLDSGLDDLADAVRAGVFPIVGIDLRPVDGIFAFYSVVVNISTDQVVVHDPLHDEGPRRIGISAFEGSLERRRSGSGNHEAPAGRLEHLGIATVYYEIYHCRRRRHRGFRRRHAREIRRGRDADRPRRASPCDAAARGSGARRDRKLRRARVSDR